MAQLMKSVARRWLRTACVGWLRLRSARLPQPPAGSATLIIAPHQDDETLGCGALIARRAREGGAIRVAYITDGSGSHPDHPSVGTDQLVRLRNEEAKAAMIILGLGAENLHFLSAPDGRLPHLSADERQALLEQLVALFGRLAPSQVFVPSRLDGSSEHMAAFRLVAEALARAAPAAVLYEYPVWSWWNPRFLVQIALKTRRVYRLPVDPNRLLKRRALAKYRSQIEALPPWTQPVLSAEFTRAFDSEQEYFFTD